MGRYNPYGVNAQRQANMRGNVIGRYGGRWNPGWQPGGQYRRPTGQGQYGLGPEPPGGAGAWGPNRIGPNNPGGAGAWGPQQMGEDNERSTGFLPPGGITINVGTMPGGSENKQPTNVASSQTRNRKRQALQQRRYGQEQGMGRGYQSPRPRVRRSPTDYAPQQATATSGYAARTAGMYGGRPSTMRDQWSNKASVTSPFGGRAAVKRYYDPQAY